MTDEELKAFVAGLNIERMIAADLAEHCGFDPEKFCANVDTCITVGMRRCSDGKEETNWTKIAIWLLEEWGMQALFLYGTDGWNKQKNLDLSLRFGGLR